MGRHHPARAQRMDLLGSVRKKGGDQAQEDRLGLREPARRQAPPLLLARMPLPGETLSPVRRATSRRRSGGGSEVAGGERGGGESGGLMADFLRIFEKASTGGRMNSLAFRALIASTAVLASHLAAPAAGAQEAEVAPEAAAAEGSAEGE